MKAASVNELRQELSNTSQADLAELCVRLARFKKENKELLTYLLFEAFDEAAYIENVKKEMEDQFAAINTTNLYFAKKSLRKILRVTAKYIRYTGSAEAEISLLLHFCKTLEASGIPFADSPVLLNMYRNQVKKIGKVTATLHEDLQYEYVKELRQLAGSGLV